jgi:hypothetical protein
MEKNLQKARKFKKVFLYSLLGPAVTVLLSIITSLIPLSSEIGNVLYPSIIIFSSITWLVVLVTLVIWIAALIADQAALKGRNWKSFFILSLFFPFIMWIVVSVMTTDQSQPISGTIKCPKCAEYVKAEASLCKHCGSTISSAK